MTDKKFDFDAALKAIQNGQPLTGADGVIAPLLKQLTEAALEAEMDTYLQENPNPNNRRNGFSQKTIKPTLPIFTVWLYRMLPLAMSPTNCYRNLKPGNNALWIAFIHLCG